MTVTVSLFTAVEPGHAYRHALRQPCPQLAQYLYMLARVCQSVQQRGFSSDLLRVRGSGTWRTRTVYCAGLTSTGS